MDEQNLPIDIHVAKLPDWLISRHHVNRDWPEHVRIIREKINNAIQDMPEHPEITALLTGTYINYFHCLKIIDILKETEKDTKNILGWYGSQRMKDWQEVVKLYEKENVFLGEAAQSLVRNISYEIPAIRRQIAKCIQVQQECERKENDCVKNVAAANVKYFESCHQIGIKGNKIKHELRELLRELPQDLDVLAEQCKMLTDARQFYSDFLSFTLKMESDAACLPLLKFVTDNGNCSVYEWTYGEPPVRIEEPLMEAILLDEDEDKDILQLCKLTRNQVVNEVIDFDFDSVTVGETVDFGDDLTGDDIDWGNLATADEQIEWGVNEVDQIPVVDIVVEDSGLEGGVARSHEALSILCYVKTRSQFLDELLELQGFLSQRINELSSEGSVLSLNLFASASASVQYQSVENVRMMVNQVKSLVAGLTSTKMQHLFLIAMSSRYVDRLSASLQTKQALGDKISALQKRLTVRRQEAQTEEMSLDPQMRLIASKTKELQCWLQEAISQRYKGRPVNIMGVVGVV